MKAAIFVSTGEAWAAKHDVELRADGLGSCCAVVAYDKKSRIGGIAHVMLPGSSRAKHMTLDSKYAEDAMEDLIFKMKHLGADENNIETCLAGGANMLGDEDNKLCNEIIDSVRSIQKKYKFPITAEATGKKVSRSVKLDIISGEVSCSENSAQPFLLYKWG